MAAVLRDPDPVMAESAVVTHLNRSAARLSADEGFPARSRAMTGVLVGRVFPDRRLRRRTLLKVITRGEPRSAEQLTEASDWCRRTAVQHLDGYETLYRLASDRRPDPVRPQHRHRAAAPPDRGLSARGTPGRNHRSIPLTSRHASAQGLGFRYPAGYQRENRCHSAGG
ncbi:hypothetical protein [Streptomyces sp. NPDC059979]|uniref:hypothetical protein n=1 Tax=Streptomyces sp. NPDC059979 TaxID=3347021 RepID=UPI003692ADED